MQQTKSVKNMNPASVIFTLYRWSCGVLFSKIHLVYVDKLWKTPRSSMKEIKYCHSNTPETFA